MRRDITVDVHRRSNRLVSFAILCGVISSSCNYNSGVGVVSAFSPTTYKTSITSITNGVAIISMQDQRPSSTTKLYFKNLDNDGEDNIQSAANNNETATSSLTPNIGVSVDVNVDVKKEIIHYNDMDPESLDTSSFDKSFISSSSSTDGSDQQEKDSSTNELKEVIEQKNINMNKPKAIEPTKSKPTKKFLSPIQMIKKVPKVEPIHMSTVLFLSLINEWPNAPTADKTGSSGGSSTAFVPPPSKKNIKPKVDNAIKSKPPVVESWKTKMKKKPTTFQATNYLESLGGSDNKKKSDTSKEKDEDDLLKALRDQQAQYIASQKQAMLNAMREANRRTKDINKVVIDKRIEDEHQKRKNKERDKLARLYVERKERLDAKKMILEETTKEDLGVEEGEEEFVTSDNLEDISDQESVPSDVASKNGKRRGIPILDILTGRSLPGVADAPPLLVGSSLTYQYSHLTPFQQRAIQVAQSYHDEHCEQMITKDESEAGIEASPIVAVIDGYTASALDAPNSTYKQKKTSTSKLRYATLASIEIVESDSKNGEPIVVKFTGVGRVFLHDYYSSKDAGLTREEEELSKMLARIQEFDEEFDYDVSEDGDEEEDTDNELPVVMAEFNIVLDGTDKASSDIHNIAELHRTANKVYRLHEERKKLVDGVRAGIARLYHGKKRLQEQNCDIEYEDCDGLGLVGLVDGDATSNFEDVSVPAFEEHIRSDIETMNNYGFGYFGLLSTIPDLTKQLMSTLEPYYSPQHRVREEYGAEVASMVSFNTLKEYATPQELAAALLIPSATERLELGYAIMIRHRNELNDLVKIVSEELSECGEECTDLW